MSATEEEEIMRPSAAVRELAFVTVEIGIMRIQYRIHRALLVKHSEFFKKALNGPWKEAQDSCVKLEDVDSTTFDVFVDWLYTGQLPTNGCVWRGIKIEHDEISLPGPVQLAKIEALVFANRIMAHTFQRHVNVSLVKSLILDNGPPSYKSIIFAFANLPADNPILTLLVELQCRRFLDFHDKHENGEIERRRQLPHDFLIRVMVRFSRISTESRSGEPLVICDYHGHATDEERKTCKHKVKTLIGRT